MVKWEVWLISGYKTPPEVTNRKNVVLHEVETQTADCKRDGQDKITWFSEVRGIARKMGC